MCSGLCYQMHREFAHGIHPIDLQELNESILILLLSTNLLRTTKRRRQRYCNNGYFVVLYRLIELSSLDLQNDRLEVQHMYCSKCGNISECRTAKVYYAEIISMNSTTRNTLLTTQTTTTTRYRKPRECNVSICTDCIVKRKRRNILLTPVYFLIVISIFAAIVKADQTLLSILSGVWLFSIFVVIIVLLIKKYKTNISESDVYIVARNQLKKQLKKASKKARFEFWSKYPTHLKTAR